MSCMQKETSFSSYRDGDLHGKMGKVKKESNASLAVSKKGSSIRKKIRDIQDKT